MEMVSDRGFYISEEEEEITDFETSSLFFFNEDFEEISEDEGGVNLQTLISGKRKSGRVEGFFEIYKNDANETLVVYVAPPPRGKKGIDKAESDLLTAILRKITPNQVIIVTENHRIVKDFIYYNPTSKFSIFLTEEIMFNPSRHDYQVEYIKTDKQGPKNRLTKRVDSDIIMRYHGYVKGDVLMERSKNQGYDASLINDEVFYVLVVADKN